MTSPKPKLSYFDFAGAVRCQPIRDCFKLAGIAFDDERITFPEWPARKPTTPFGSIPVLTVGDLVISSSNAILRYVATQAGLYPHENLLQAAKVDEIFDSIESFIATIIGPTINLQDKEKLKLLREDIVNNSGALFFGNLEKVLEKNGAACGYAVGHKFSAADLKVYYLVSWIKSGRLDHIPTTFADKYACMNAIFHATEKEIARIK